MQKKSYLGGGVDRKKTSERKFVPLSRSKRGRAKKGEAQRKKIKGALRFMGQLKGLSLRGGGGAKTSRGGKCWRCQGITPSSKRRLAGKRKECKRKGKYAGWGRAVWNFKWPW